MKFVAALLHAYAVACGIGIIVMLANLSDIDGASPATAFGCTIAQGLAALGVGRWLWRR